MPLTLLRPQRLRSHLRSSRQPPSFFHLRSQPSLPQPPTPPGPPPPGPPTAVPPVALPDPSGFRWAEVANGFARALGLEATPDGRLFVLEQRGVIWVIQDGVVLPDPFLDIRDRVESSAFEQGLLGLALHPQFLANGFFYLNYTRFGGDTVIARFSASAEPHRAAPG